MKFILNPFLVIYYDPLYKSLTVVDVLYKRHFALADTDWLKLIDFLKSEKSKKEIEVYLRDGKSSIDTSLLVEELIDKNIIVGNSPVIKDIIRQKGSFAEKNWDSAFIYHLYSRDYPFLDYSKPEHGLKDISFMEEYMKKWSPPSIYKEYTGKKFKLSDISKIKKTFFPLKTKNKVLLNKKTLSFLLHYGFGQVGTAHFKVLGEAVLRTSPSGGARHPTEAYLLNLTLKGIPVGIFHYSVKENCLELINKKKLTLNYKKIFTQLNQVPNFKPAAIIVLTSLAERSMWRYREARSFRVLFFDMGHIITTVKVIANAFGLGISVGDGFSEKKLKEVLELDGINEQPFSFIALS